MAEKWGQKDELRRDAIFLPPFFCPPLRLPLSRAAVLTVCGYDTHAHNIARTSQLVPHVPIVGDAREWPES
jgi:hypothetical protein